MKRAYPSFRPAKLLIPAVLALLLSLGLLAALALAIELPPAGSIALLQTSGPNTALGIGDWYTNAGQGNRPHSFKIFVPCTIAPGQVFTVELFDPELLAGAGPPDEIRPNPAAADDATFTLLAPDNSVIATQTYTPSTTTDNQFVNFTTFTTGASGCGIYTLQATTSNDDDNAWSLRITPDDPDGLPGSGDEIALASFETSFQYATDGCQDLFFFVPDQAQLRLNNFDVDFPGFDPNATVTYFPPGAGPVAGTASGGTVWNNGGGAAHPPPGGDVFNNPTSGWWRAEICARAGNQYIFEPEGLVYFFNQPPIPDMTVSKDDGQTLVTAGQTITYTISFNNIGSGAAVDVTLNDTLPASTTFVACSGGLACGEVAPPGSGVVTYSLGLVPAGTGGQVSLTIRLDNNFPPSSTLTNTVQLNYADVLGNSYPPVEATDVNQTPAVGPDLTINKSDGGITTAPGAVVPYGLTFANVSPTGATGVVITDTVPANTTFNAAASAPTVWSCADGSPPGTTCTTTIGAVPGNTGGSVTFALTLDDPLPTGVTSIANTATIGDDGTNGPDPTPGNNSSSDTTPLSTAPPPELQLTKRNRGGTAAPGGPIIYTLTYANTSSTGATGVVITDTVPANTTFNAAASAPTLWSCADGSSAGTTCTTTIGAVPGNTGGSVTFAVTVNKPLPASVTGIFNTAVIGDDGANGPESALGNNTDSNTVPLAPAGSPPAGDTDDDDDDDDPGRPTPPAAAEAGPVQSPAVQPTPELPVLFLPETGTKEAQINPITGLVLPWLAGLGAIFMLSYLWHKWTKK